MLHDEVLPLIHTAMLSLSAGKPADVAFKQLSDAHQEVSNLLRDLPMTTTPDIARLGLIATLRKMVDVEFAPGSMRSSGGSRTALSRKPISSAR